MKIHVKYSLLPKPWHSNFLFCLIFNYFHLYLIVIINNFCLHFCPRNNIKGAGWRKQCESDYKFCFPPILKPDKSLLYVLYACVWAWTILFTVFHLIIRHKFVARCVLIFGHYCGTCTLNPLLNMSLSYSNYNVIPMTIL